MALDLFSLPVRTWFERRFPHGPTPAQLQGWPEIAAGRHTLIAAPTGSGKTLSAFLVWIDRLYRAAVSGELENAGFTLIAP
ncbi:MAG TPA: DEAD/DEAH box helicase, partial [Polyangiales bacterium]|nr:DEAD/DEAH box helicase [Polyangiales bacterium]